MSLEKIIERIPSLARIDPAAIDEAGVWAAPFLLPGKYNGYYDPAIVADVAAGRWLGKAALEPLFADSITPDSAVIERVPVPRILYQA
jgi:hypothetical protein